MNGELIYQIYRGGFSGGAAVVRDKLGRALDRFAAHGGKHVAFHGFPRELGGAWDGLAKMAKERGLVALAAWGLDGEADNDGTRLTGAEKGACMGAVLATATCAGGLADAEGRWDDAHAMRPGDVTDTDDALALGEALRKAAPNALVGDQCWFAIDSHGSLRVKPVADPRDIFVGFPVDEFARKVVNWHQFRQAYCNEAGFKARWGGRRYRKIFDWMERDWALLKEPFARAGLHYNPGVTVQMYGWDDIPWHLVDAMITAMGTKGQPMVGWWDPDSSPAVALAAYRAYLFLRDRGYVQLGRSGAETVLAYQREFNKTAKVKIEEDGLGGPSTWLSMGIKVDA